MQRFFILPYEIIYGNTPCNYIVTTLTETSILLTLVRRYFLLISIKNSQGKRYLSDESLTRSIFAEESRREKREYAGF